MVVLIIDDEEHLRDILADEFESSGHKTVRAADGQEGLNIAISQNVDAVVTDIHLPNLSGLDVAAQLKRRRPSLPVFLLSGDLDQASAKPTSEYPMFIKPFSLRDLYLAVVDAHSKSVQKDVSGFLDSSSGQS